MKGMFYVPLQWALNYTRFEDSHHIPHKVAPVSRPQDSA
jgi:hypothetical protein